MARKKGRPAVRILVRGSNSKALLFVLGVAEAGYPSFGHFLLDSPGV